MPATQRSQHHRHDRENARENWHAKRVLWRVAFAALLFTAWFLGTLTPSIQNILRQGVVPFFISELFRLPKTSSLERKLTAIRGNATDSTRTLENHSDEFRKSIQHVVGNVYVAVGYGLANVMFIDGGRKGLVVIDAMESKIAMAEAVSDLRKMLIKSSNDEQSHEIFARPAVALIYSHFHTDHTFGASSVAEPGVTEIWSHERTAIELEKVFELTAGTTYRRSMRQFGVFLNEDDGFVNSGIGPSLSFKGSDDIGLMRPTNIWTGDEHTINVAGETLVLLKAPGESIDQTVIWFPKYDLLMGADNIYKAFPNIYAIRGTQSRDAREWVASLDMMRRLKPTYLVLGHTAPIVGKELIAETLLAYRDAIQFVHDQTIRGMNVGTPLVDLATKLELPPHLRSHPYLQPYYGTVEWSIKAVYTHYVGWYTENTELFSMSTKLRAQRMEELSCRNYSGIHEAAEAALLRGDYQWAIELSTHAVALDSNERNKATLSEAMRQLGLSTTNAPARNWLLTSANENDGLLGPLALSRGQRRQTVNRLESMYDLLNFIPTRLKAEETLDMDLAVAFKFTDTGEGVCVHVRRGIAHVSRSFACADRPVPDTVIETDSDVWRQIVNREANAVAALAKRKLKATSGSIFDLVRLMNAVDYE